jgi:hypothetical protein
MEGVPVTKYPEEWEPLGRPDPLRTKDRATMAPWRCDLCLSALMLVEVGPHYRARHPEDRPRVTYADRADELHEWKVSR